MHIIKDLTPIVIIGHWNPIIFTAEWAKEFLFPAQEIKVELSVEKHYALKLSAENIQIYVSETTVRISVIKEPTDEIYEECQNIAFKLCDYLTHTPVVAFGVNFAVQLKIEELGGLKNLLTMSDETKIKELGFTEQTGIKIERSFKNKSNILNLGIETVSNEEIKIRLNHHFAVKSMTEIKKQLSEKDILTLQKESASFLLEVYNLKV